MTGHEKNVSGAIERGEAQNNVSGAKQSNEAQNKASGTQDKVDEAIERGEAQNNTFDALSEVEGPSGRIVGSMRVLPGNATVEAVLFDLDGTLLDTEDLILDSFRYATTKVLGAPLPDEDLRDFIGIPLESQLHKINPEYAKEMLIAYRENNALVHDDLIKCFPGTPGTLATLKERGYRLAVVTSKRSDAALRGLRFFDLEGFFELVLGPDMTQRHKPDPEPLLVAAERMGLSSEQCAYIGDSPYDMQAARGAGMLAVAALWGMFTRERLQEAGAQQEAKSIEDLLRLFP